MTYFDELTKAMTALGRRPDTVFLGQAVAYPGTGMSRSLEGVPIEKRIELPVMEDAQLGMAIGMSLAGRLPICIYPRINFLLLAVNQLVLHLDKIPLYGNGYNPKVIIRTSVAHHRPMDPGVQHLGDYSSALNDMLDTVHVRVINHKDEVRDAYDAAVARPQSTILVEKALLYDT